jgi:hypothetical protein
MIRKAILSVGIAVLLLAIFVGRNTASYIRTSVGYVKESAQNSIPIDFQLRRARQMIVDLAPEVQKNMHLIAKEEVEVQRLDNQIADSEKRLAKEKEQLVQLRNALETGKHEFQFGGRKYGIEQVKLDLTNRFQRYKTGDATLASLRQIETARQRSLEAARQKLEGMLAAKRQLLVVVENLEARSQMVAAAQTTSNYKFDESQLGRLKQLIDDLRTRLEVDERMVNSDLYYHDEIPVDKPSPDDIAQQVGSYFQKQTAGEKQAATSKQPTADSKELVLNPEP